MQSALKDFSAVIATVVVIAYATGQRNWLWNQLYAMRKAAIQEMKHDWGCPSVFDKKACKRLK